MFACKELTVKADDSGRTVLNSVTAHLQGMRLNAVVGPSGCGKTTWMKAMLRLVETSGEVILNNEPVEHFSTLVGRVGLAPQFSIAHPLLTVEESLTSALDLCCSDAAEKKRRAESILQIVGLDSQRGTRVASLSGGQLRRLGLALELAPDPAWLICDEVTSGLDPNAEDDILKLLRSLCMERGKTFVCIIHNLAKLEDFDWISVMYQGNVVFQGDYAALLAYFELSDPLHLYDVLAGKPLKHWEDRLRESQGRRPAEDWITVAENGEASGALTMPPRMPGLFSQCATIFQRRLKLFARDSGALILMACITLGFPMLVVMFAMNGLPPVPSLPPLQGVAPTMDDLMARAAYEIEITRVGSLIVGLVLFQVVLLTLMGSNNGAREIAAERSVYEKERLRGLQPMAYVLAKTAFVSLISMAQGLWMAVFVKMVSGFPGALLPQLLVFALSGIAMGLVSLGCSATMTTTERASLLPVYIVGFQLPLAGVVLQLPEAMTWICRPFINAYWAWSGYLKAMEDTRYYDAAQQAYDGLVASPGVAAVFLVLQALVGFGFTVWGCLQMRWN